MPIRNTSSQQLTTLLWFHDEHVKCLTGLLLELASYVDCQRLLNVTSRIRRSIQTTSSESKPNLIFFHFNGGLPLKCEPLTSIYYRFLPSRRWFSVVEAHFCIAVWIQSLLSFILRTAHHVLRHFVRRGRQCTHARRREKTGDSRASQCASQCCSRCDHWMAPTPHRSYVHTCRVINNLADEFRNTFISKLSGYREEKYFDTLTCLSSMHKPQHLSTDRHDPTFLRNVGILQVFSRPQTRETDADFFTCRIVGV